MQTTKENVEVACRNKKRNQCKGYLHISIDTTKSCQLGCKYCYFGAKSVEDVDADKVIAAIGNLIASVNEKLDHIRVSYMGGEPTLVWPKIKDLNEQIRKMLSELKISYSWGMTSNLINFDCDKANYMKAEGAEILCSIDGPSDIQNKNRPYALKDGDSYLDVVKNVPFALEVGNRHRARITVCPEDSNRIEEIVQTIFNLGFRELSIFPNVHQAWSYSEMRSWGGGIAKAIATFESDDRRVNTIIKRTSHDQFVGIKSCGMGNKLFALSTDGVLYPCHRLTQSPEFALINASSSAPLHIKEAIKLSNQVFDVSKFPQCSACIVRERCGGGCVADNAIVNKDPQFPVATLCNLKKEAISALNDLNVSYVSRGDLEWSCFFGYCNDDEPPCEVCCDSGSCDIDHSSPDHHPLNKLSLSQKLVMSPNS